MYYEDRGNKKVAKMKDELSRIRTWSEIFDESNMESNPTISTKTVMPGAKVGDGSITMNSFIHIDFSISDSIITVLKMS